MMNKQSCRDKMFDLWYEMYTSLFHKVPVWNNGMSVRQEIREILPECRAY